MATLLRGSGFLEDVSVNDFEATDKVGNYKYCNVPTFVLPSPRQWQATAEERSQARHDLPNSDGLHFATTPVPGSLIEGRCNTATPCIE